MAEERVHLASPIEESSAVNREEGAAPLVFNRLPDSLPPNASPELVEAVTAKAHQVAPINGVISQEPVVIGIEQAETVAAGSPAAAKVAAQTPPAEPATKPAA